MKILILRANAELFQNRFEVTDPMTPTQWVRVSDRRAVGTQSQLGRNPQIPKTCIPVTSIYPLPEFYTQNPSLFSAIVIVQNESD